MKFDILEGYFKVFCFGGSYVFFLGMKIMVLKLLVVGRVRLEVFMDKIIIELVKFGMVLVGGI